MKRNREMIMKRSRNEEEMVVNNEEIVYMIYVKY